MAKAPMSGEGKAADPKVWESRRNPKGTHPIKPKSDPALEPGPNGGHGSN